MGNNQAFFTDDEFQELTGVDIQSLVASRLEDMADRVEHHYSVGNLDTAEFLRQEGLELASAYDLGVPFFYINDLTASN
jgi:hypothetical protein